MVMVQVVLVVVLVENLNQQEDGQELVVVLQQVLLGLGCLLKEKMLCLVVDLVLEVDHILVILQMVIVRENQEVVVE